MCGFRSGSTMVLSSISGQFLRRPKEIVVLVLRLLVGGLLAVTAVGKALDLQGFAQVVGTYQVLPPLLWLPVAVLMTGVEGGLAVWLFAGRRLAQAGWAAAALHLAFFSWAVYLPENSEGVGWIPFASHQVSKSASCQP